MHELPVTEQLLSIVLEHARQANARRVLKINLVLGDLSGFVGDSIQFCYDILSKDTIADQAVLEITQIPARVRCRACKHEFAPEAVNWLCPRCGGAMEEVLAGREFYVESIEVE
jgi:hydrogenase nickel incorporation protein HypA/HybF